MKKLKKSNLERLTNILLFFLFANFPALFLEKYFPVIIPGISVLSWGFFLEKNIETVLRKCFYN